MVIEVNGTCGVAVVVGGCGVAFPAAATVLLPICFTLLAAAAAFTLDEPTSAVVDVTPTGPRSQCCCVRPAMTWRPLPSAMTSSGAATGPCSRLHAAKVGRL